MGKTENKLYFGEEITKKILDRINNIFDLLNDGYDEKEGFKIDALYYDFVNENIETIYNNIKNKFDEANELKTSIISVDEICDKNKDDLKYKFHHLYMWIRDLSFFYSLCYFNNIINKNDLRKEMKELEEHINTCISALYDKKYLGNSSKTNVYNEKTKKDEIKNFYKTDKNPFMERLFIFIENEYKQRDIFDSSYYSESYHLNYIEHQNRHQNFLENVNKLLAYCAMHSSQKVWKNIDKFVIGYYCRYSLENYNSELSSENKDWLPKNNSNMQIRNMHTKDFYFLIGKFSHEKIKTKIENIEELIKWIQFDSIVNKNIPEIKIAFKWIFQNKKHQNYTAYEIFKKLKDEYGDVITERPSIALVMYELMKKMTYNEFSDIFPKVLDESHKKLAKENYEKYIGDYLKLIYPENYSEIKITKKFNINRKIKQECKILQSMMFFMIWDIMASLKGSANSSDKDAQIPEEKNDNILKTNTPTKTKQSIISNIIESIMPVIEEKLPLTSYYDENSFDKGKQIFTFEKEEEKKLIEFSQSFIHQMEDKNYIHNNVISYRGLDGEEYKDYEGRILYNKFENSKAISRYKNNYPFEWYTSQCQEKLLNDLAKDFKLNAVGLYFDFDKTVLLLEELKSFIKDFPVEEEYNALLTKLETLSKQKEFTEILPWTYLKKIYFILDNYEEIKADDLQKEWFEFYKLDIHHNQYKYKELIRKTYKALKRFSGFDELYDFVLQFDAKGNYTDLVAYLKDLKSKKYIDEIIPTRYIPVIRCVFKNSNNEDTSKIKKMYYDFYNYSLDYNKLKMIHEKQKEYKEMINNLYNLINEYSDLDKIEEHYKELYTLEYRNYEILVKDLQFSSLSDKEFKNKLYKSEEITKYISDISKKHKEIKEYLLYNLKINYVYNKKFKNNLLSWNQEEIKDRISSSKIAQKYISQFDEAEKEKNRNYLIALSITDKSIFEESLLKNNLEDFKQSISFIYLPVNENICFESYNLKYILFLLENSTKENAKNLINELLELQKLDLNSKENKEKYYKLLKEVYNIIKHYPAILKNIRNNISKEEIKNQYKAVLKKLENLNSQEKIKEKLSWVDMKIIHTILEKYKGHYPKDIEKKWCYLYNKALSESSYKPEKIAEYIKQHTQKYKDLLENTLNIVKRYSTKEIKDLVLTQIEKVQDECKKKKIKVKPTTSLFNFNNSKKEYSDDLIKKINNFLSDFQPENDSTLKEDCEQWKNKLDNLSYKLDGTNIKICERKKARDIIQILYPVLKNSKIAKTEKSLIHKLYKIYTADNPFAYANIHISADNIENASNLLYNISHYIKKEKAYGIRQINFIKEKKLNVLSTQEKIPNQFKNKNNDVSFIDACKTLNNLEEMKNTGIPEDKIKETLKPFISPNNRVLINTMKENREIWKKIDRGFEIPEFRQTLKPFISLYHCFDEIGETILSRNITCKFNDESDTLYNWKKVNDYPDANACNMSAVYFTRLRNSEEHYAQHGSIKNLIDEKYWYNLLWAFIDSYKYLEQKETWKDNNIIIPIVGLLHYDCSDLMRWFIQKEIQDLSKILCNKIKLDNLNSEDLNFWNRNIEDIKEFMKSIKDSKTKDLNYRDKYFVDNLFIERVQTLLGFMYCSNGLSIPSDLLSYERTTNKNIPLDEDFLDFYRVPTALYLIYLTMVLTEENIERLKKIE